MTVLIELVISKMTFQPDNLNRSHLCCRRMDPHIPRPKEISSHSSTTA